VIDHESDAWQITGGRQGGRQFARPNQQVENEASCPDDREPSAHRRTQQPLRIGLVVDLVTDPDQPHTTWTVPDR
jgi:hypothetical protein